MVEMGNLMYWRRKDRKERIVIIITQSVRKY